MKKSKIIVPAMCLIAFTSFASIAGSVAWFTASRQVTIDAGTYAVVKTTSNLEALVAEGVATDVSDNVVQIETGATLTDGSFDHKNNVFTTPDANGTAKSTVTPQFAIGSTGWESKLVRDATNKIYTAATFTITFTMNFGAISGDYGLFLDTSLSSFTVPGSAEAKTAKGFRMAFSPQSITGDSTALGRGKQKVYAGLQQGNKCHYVASSINSETTDTTLTASNYTTGDLMASNDTPSSGPAESATRANVMLQSNFLGYFNYVASSEVQLKYIVVAWFEGTDEEIRNRSSKDDYQSVKANLVFNAETLPTE